MATFKKSFAAARKAGKKEFTWNGKKYNTKLAADKPAPKPKSKPEVQGPKIPPKVAKGDRMAAPTPKSKPKSDRIGQAFDAAASAPKRTALQAKLRNRATTASQVKNSNKKLKK